MNSSIMWTFLLGYSAGWVLAGFIAGAMGLGFGKMIGLPNPWSSAIGIITFFLTMSILRLTHVTGNAKPEHLILCISFLPALIWALGGSVRHRNRQQKAVLQSELPY